MFRGSPGDAAERKKYAAIVIDYEYLKNAEKFDEAIDRNVDLTDLDEAFRDANFELLERFYKLFESIYKYITDLKAYFEELTNGTFVAHTLEGVLLDAEGKQLCAEALCK